jgi:hypothetical protein
VLRIDPQEDVSEIESRIAEITQVAQESFYLMCMGRILRSGASAADYGISTDSTLIMTGRLLSRHFALKTDMTLVDIPKEP